MSLLFLVGSNVAGASSLSERSTMSGRESTALR